jgi:hypothetical protein
VTASGTVRQYLHYRHFFRFASVLLSIARSIPTD